MASEERIEASCRRLQSSRAEIVELIHVLKGDRPAAAGPNVFPRSRIMRALTSQQGRTVLKNAALALAMSRPKTAWRLAGLAPLLRPAILRYLAARMMRPRRAVSPVADQPS